jgi:hypothetical protein
VRHLALLRRQVDGVLWAAKRRLTAPKIGVEEKSLRVKVCGRAVAAKVETCLNTPHSGCRLWVTARWRG